MNPPEYVVVIPTIGRPCLQACLDALSAAAGGYPPAQVVIVDDRRDQPDPLAARIPPALADRTVVLTLDGRGPATARNAGWRAALATEWVVFLDDDVLTGPGWGQDLAADLAGAPPRTGGVQGKIEVPWPPGRRPADSQRATLGLADARWITADMAYRRAALADAGGFDERFGRAYREDSDLALRVRELGWSLSTGRRRTAHPVRPPSRWASIAAQRGNADDAAMRALHGPGWRRRAQTGRGRFRVHLSACALGAAAAILGAAGVRRGAAGVRRGAAGVRSGAAGVRSGAMLCAAGWAGLTGEFAARRIMAGSRAPGDVADMIVTSAAIPPLAVWHRIAGWRRFRGARPWPPPPAAVLFDRDGTLVHDVPYNGDPNLVTPVPGAAASVAALRRAGVRTGVVTNQSGIGRGHITTAQAAEVNAAVDRLIGPFGTWQVCPHRGEDGCGCRKPSPGLITAAADALGVAPAECVVIGDIGADVAAARAAGARAVLVPTPATQAAERAGAPCATTITEATAAILGGRRIPSWEAT